MCTEIEKYQGGAQEILNAKLTKQLGMDDKGIAECRRSPTTQMVENNNDNPNGESNVEAKGKEKGHNGKNLKTIE